MTSSKKDHASCAVFVIVPLTIATMNSKTIGEFILSLACLLIFGIVLWKKRPKDKRRKK